MEIPDHTAVRVALWRAMHVQLDAYPHVFEDELGLRLVNPDESWKQRPDMHPIGTRGYRASIVGRARLIEDLVQEQFNLGVDQYVILGAGLDTFAQRRKDLIEKIDVFEIDKPETQTWKRQRLIELGYGIPDHLHLVPVDFESGHSWPHQLSSNGFDFGKSAIITSTGVSMYLTKEANLDQLRKIATFAPGTTFAMTFMLPLDLIDPSERVQHEMVYERARASGTPFISFFRPNEILSMAQDAGLKQFKHVSRNEMIERYFAARTDGLQPSHGEEFLIAKT